MELHVHDVTIIGEKRYYHGLLKIVRLVIAQNRLNRNKAAYDKASLTPAAKTQPKPNTCRQWCKNGKCSRGDDCAWASSHTKANAPKPREKSPAPKPQGEDKPRGRSPGPSKGKGKEAVKRGTSPSGEADKPPCFDYIKGTCTRGKACSYWHPPVCKFWKAGSCTTKGCCFLHNDKPKKALKSGEAAPAPAKDPAEPKAKPKAKPKAAKQVMAVLFPFSLKEQKPTACQATETCSENLSRDAKKSSKRVKFPKVLNKVANRHGKFPSYLKYFPYAKTKPVTEFLSKEAIKHYEAWYRDQAYKWHCDLYPDEQLSREAFFSYKGSTPTPKCEEPSNDKKLAPKILKPTRYAARAQRVSPANTREYIVDSGASFHLVSEDSLTPKELSSKVELEEPIEVQTANGDVVITHKCRIHVIELDLWVWAHLLECTVAVLSLGALCGDHGFSYTWNNTNTPTLLKGNLEVKCEAKNNVPFIYAVEGNLNPALSEEALIEDILDEIDPPPTPDDDWTVVRPRRRGRSRG